MKTIRHWDLVFSVLNYRRILYPVDFSLRCRQMAPLAVEVASRFSSEVILLHVIEVPLVCDAPEFIEKQRDRMNAELEEFAESAFSELPVKRLLVVAQAERNHADLIMMPTYGRGIFRRQLLGSVTAKVLNDSRIPIWTNAHNDRYPVPMDYRLGCIVCATANGERDEQVRQAASELAQAYDAEVHLVYSPGGQGVRQAAEDYGADLVVIGRGEHATGIIRESPCPVLSV
jgi:nucleotide-binding universal stress UspA family protein